MLRSVVHGAIPVFVAATISRAVTGLIEYSTHQYSIQIEIIAYLLYSLLIAHVVGYLVALYVPRTHLLFRYAVLLATENAGFAWSSTVTLIIVKWLLSNGHTAATVVAWAWITILIFLVVYLSNYLQRTLLRVSDSTRLILRNFESEALALPLAYSLTIIISDAMYKELPAETVTYNDDEIDNSAPSLSYSPGWYFFAYTVSITIILVALQQFFHYLQDRKKRRRAKALLESNEDETIIDFKHDSTSERVSGLISLPDPLRTIEEPTFCSNCAFGWDEDKLARKTLRRLLRTSTGYMVGCAWHIWSVMTVEVNTNYFIGVVRIIYDYSCSNGLLILVGPIVKKVENCWVYFYTQ